ncbi:hypothetical protein [Paenibacillus brasilensis]|uniref:Uncharacterized protein n=1 Tax=Paenibacillus brasilensis TaxID=128574 RepID=A0ABU0L5J2_9BACL|nr:hypothetical protein [Paenibacillus brasilensis]MDQ0496555.1 hypothetical protein [Paenibacillus brasilensis]
MKNKEYEKAKNAVLLDFEHFKNADSGLYRTERSVYDYTVFMLTADNNPITKYSYIQFAKPIEGVLTQQQLDQYIAEWKPKSEAASMNVQKQIDEALAGLSLEEKSFVKGYVIGSINGKKPDPNVVAAQATMVRSSKPRKKRKSGCRTHAFWRQLKNTKT